MEWSRGTLRSYLLSRSSPSMSPTSNDRTWKRILDGCWVSPADSFYGSPPKIFPLWNPNLQSDSPIPSQSSPYPYPHHWTHNNFLHPNCFKYLSSASIAVRGTLRTPRRLRNQVWKCYDSHWHVHWSAWTNLNATHVNQCACFSHSRPREQHLREVQGRGRDSIWMEVVLTHLSLSEQLCTTNDGEARWSAINSHQRKLIAITASSTQVEL